MWNKIECKTHDRNKCVKNTSSIITIIMSSLPCLVLHGTSVFSRLSLSNLLCPCLGLLTRLLELCLDRLVIILQLHSFIFGWILTKMCRSELVTVISVNVTWTFSVNSTWLNVSHRSSWLNSRLCHTMKVEDVLPSMGTNLMITSLSSTPSSTRVNTSITFSLTRVFSERVTLTPSVSSQSSWTTSCMTQ